MRFDDLCVTFDSLPFPDGSESAHPDESTVRSARSGVTEAVNDDEFLADCLALELDLIESGRIRLGLTPFFVLPRQGIQFSFGHWAPGATPGPHEHTAWTITAVCRNELDVFTYDRDASYRQRKLVPKNLFQADAGKVGFIFRPCIHAPINNSSDWSLSFHATSPRDGERPPDCMETIPELRFGEKASSIPADHPYAAVIDVRRRRRRLWQVARTLAAMTVERAAEPLSRCYKMAAEGDRRRLRQAIPSLAKTDSVPASDTLVRTDQRLVMTHRFNDGQVSLVAETPDGPHTEMTASRPALEAIGFAAKEARFRVSELPGNLTNEERGALGEALEETGLYRRAAA